MKRLALFLILPLCVVVGTSLGVTYCGDDGGGCPEGQQECNDGDDPQSPRRTGRMGPEYRSLRHVVRRVLETGRLDLLFRLIRHDH